MSRFSHHGAGAFPENRKADTMRRTKPSRLALTINQKPAMSETRKPSPSKTDSEKFIAELKESGGHFIQKIMTADSKTMVYYRESSSYTTDVKTRVFKS